MNNKLKLMLLLCSLSIIFFGCTSEKENTSKNKGNMHDYSIKDDADNNDFISEFIPDE